jgi:hypothetical protein
MLRRKTEIERLCRRSGKWAVIEFDRVDRYQVRTTTARHLCEVTVRHVSGKRACTRFQCWLPVQFSLQNPPSGLFGRLLMRSWDLRWSAWHINIADSCEASACLSVLIPNAALDARLFDDICREMTEEVLSFHRELRDKFNYHVAAASVRQPGTAGVPMIRPGGSTPDIRYL